MTDLTGDGAELIQALAELGGRTSNAKLREQIGWHTERYFAARDHCRSVGLIGLSRGRGGIVVLTDAARASLPDGLLAEQEAAAAEERERETAYYAKLLPTLQGDWVSDQGFDQSVVEQTAAKRVKGVGRWTVPDFVVVGKTTYQYIPSFEFTVQSLEVKRFEVLDALAVFEALNHRRAAHFSYLLVVNYPSRANNADEAKIEQIEQLCFEHDVGLVLIPKGQEGRYEKWDSRVEPDGRAQPENYNLDAFFKQYVNSETQEAVAKMVR